MGTITVAEVYLGLRYPEGYRWPAGGITYSIPGPGQSFWSNSSYEPGSEPFDPAFGVLNTAQRAQFINAIGAWEQVINVDLQEVPDNAITVGQIRIAFTDTAAQGVANAAAYAYTPPNPGSGGSPFNGDVWIDKDYNTPTEDAAFGSYFYSTMLHELGHALGLKHPQDGMMLPAEFNSTRYTVMSYNSFEDASYRYFALDGGTLFANTEFVNPTTPMLLDIVAIQGIYGASNSANLAADTYTFDETRPMMMTIVDDGGIDTFNLSNLTRGSLIDLTPGGFSSVGYFSVDAQIAFYQARFPNFSRSFIADYLNKTDTYTWSNNVATALNTVVENVIGSAAADTITGNTAANSLSGGAGNDMIMGGGGGDTIVGGAAGNIPTFGNYLRGDDGNDSIVGGDNFDDVNGNMGNDTIAGGTGNDWLVGGKDQDVITAGSGDNLVYGNLGDDSLDGGGGADIVRGGQGNDTLIGGAGNDFVSGDRGEDTMMGGAGADIFHSSMDAGIDRVLDFSLAQGDRVQLDPGTTFTVMQMGGDTMIMMSAGSVILVGIQASTLPAGTIFGA